MKNEYDVIIIGGGIIGTTIAYQLSKNETDVLLLEKNNYLADETSMGNSGLIHAGFDAEAKIEAKMNLEGNNLWRNEILKNITIPYVEVPSLIVAFNDEEVEEVKKLYKRGIKNKLDPSTMKILNKKEIIKMEPHIKKDVKSALLATTSIAVDPVLATRALAGVAKQNGVNIKKSSKVTKIEFKKDIYVLTINNKEKFYAKNIVNAAGHFADDVAKLSGDKSFELVAKRGEYRILAKSEASKVNNIVFKVPTIHGKGVIVAPMLDGRVLIGPTAEDGIKKEDTRLVTPAKYQLIGHIGHDIIPDLNLDRTEKIYSGSRPIYKKTNDFYIKYGERQSFINVAGTQSPGLSSAPSIALEVEKMLKKNGTELARKEDFKNKFEVMW